MPLRSLACLFLIFATPALAEQVLRSGPAQTLVLELYTSEGCSSCPPADRWFSKLVDRPELWQGLVPLAFHVDYWDDLGWKDRFACPAYSQRQRDYRRHGGIKAVYTPGVIAAGQEWRSWRLNPDALPPAAEAVGVLELRLDGSGFTAQFEPVGPAPARPLQLHVAVLGFGLGSPVKAGENRGRELKHDFVVLAHSTFKATSGRYQGRVPQAALADQAERLALAAWVSETGRQEPVQAVGGWW